MKRTIVDWLKVLVLLLDEAAVIVIAIFALQCFDIQIPLSLKILIALFAGVLVLVIHIAVIPSFHKKHVTGREGMLGQKVTVIESLIPVGTVMVNGERWKAKSVSDDIIETGEDVEIVKIDGLTLKVECLKL